MKRLLYFVLSLAAVAGILWAVVSNLEYEPTGRNEAPAVLLRAPEGFTVEKAGTLTLEAAAAALDDAVGDRVGIEFSEKGDSVILLADRIDQQVIELRAARTGTIVERTWSGDVDRRLAWAKDNGDLDAPGLPPATGKNLYH